MTLYLHGVVAISRSVSNDNHITFRPVPSGIFLKQFGFINHSDIAAAGRSVLSCGLFYIL
ncbi:hypothetical protein RCO48_16200 [Peribacillus frigoritolerans]|nr:hypothetical protein [Peribacillus frigoritolerans]